jgi:hypothetical protein
MTPWPLSPRVPPDAPVRRDSGPGAEGWRDTAPGDLTGCGWLLLLLGAVGAAALGALGWHAVRGGWR